MALNLLTDTGILKVAIGDKGFLLSDGGGLYLRVGKARVLKGRTEPKAVTENRTSQGKLPKKASAHKKVAKVADRSWVFIYERGKKRTEIGLGGYPSVTLERARALRTECRRLLDEGRDPRLARGGGAAANTPKASTFGEVAEIVLKKVKAESKNPKHADQWDMTLRHYAKPLWPKPWTDIGTDDVIAVLQPHWSRVPETAARLRGRIENVLDAARARQRDLAPTAWYNPATWRGHLSTLLSARSKLTRGNHPALPYSEIPTFMKRLHGRAGLARLATEFLILTAARTSEARLAVWSEFDFEKEMVWTVPAERTKTGKEHVVPLSDRAIAILKEVKPLCSVDNFVFPGMKPGAPLSDMTLTAVLRRMGIPRGVASIHGFRSTFTDWVGDETEYPEELADHALSHQVGNAVKRAYRRKKAIEKRRPLMKDWERYCLSKIEVAS